jgi:hypothetical protein
VWKIVEETLDQRERGKAPRCQQQAEGDFDVFILSSFLRYHCMGVDSNFKKKENFRKEKAEESL